MHVIPRWKVVASFADRPDVVLWLHDAHLANVLRTVAGMQFSENGLKQPCFVSVDKVRPQPNEQVESDPRASGAVRCPLGHFMRYDITDDSFHCECGAVASKHGAIIVNPDLEFGKGV